MCWRAGARPASVADGRHAPSPWCSGLQVLWFLIVHCLHCPGCKEARCNVIGQRLSQSPVGPSTLSRRKQIGEAGCEQTQLFLSRNQLFSLFLSGVPRRFFISGVGIIGRNIWCAFQLANTGQDCLPLPRSTNSGHDRVCAFFFLVIMFPFLLPTALFTASLCVCRSKWQ